MKTEEKAVSLWEGPKLAEVKKQYGDGLTSAEWGLFVGIGEALGLNPFLREIWCVKYGGKASVFIGRDGYRKVAQKNPDYDYHFVDAVYAGDELLVNPTDVAITHKKAIGERGKLVGAYCLVKRKGSSKPNYVFVDLSEYMGNSKSLWGTKPATMIKKVAEAQCLRMTFQELFAGTYEESEDFTEKATVQDVTPKAAVVPKKEPMITAAQIKKFNAVIGEFAKLKKSTKENIGKGKKALLMSQFKLESTKDLTKKQAIKAIDLMEKAVEIEKAKQAKAAQVSTAEEVFEAPAIDVAPPEFPL